MPVSSASEFDYRGDLDDSPHDWWISATERAFRIYNQPNISPEDQLTFVEKLPIPLRYALVCLLYEGAVNNGGLDLMFSSMGLLVPEVVAGLSYYGLQRQSARLQDLTEALQLAEFPRSHNELMDAFEKQYPEDQKDRLTEFEIEYYTLDPDDQLTEKVQERISREPHHYFRPEDHSHG